MGKFLTYAEAKRRNLLVALVCHIDGLDINVRAANILTNMGLEIVYTIIQTPLQTFLRQKGLGHKTLRNISEAIEELGLELEMVLTDLLKRKLDIPLTGNEPHEEEVVEATMEGREEMVVDNVVQEKKSAVPSKEDLVKQHEQLGEELRLLGSDLETLTNAMKIYPAAEGILKGEIGMREAQINEKREAHQHLQIAIQHYDAFRFVLERNN